MDAFYDDADGDLLLQSHMDHSFINPSQLTTPQQFPDFPYPNIYPQQLELMQRIYETLEQNKCGLFESPTGTGKSISLLTASMKWLVDHNARQMAYLDTLNNALDNNTTEKADSQVDHDWIQAFDKVRLVKRTLQPQIEQLTGLKRDLDQIEVIKNSNFNPLAKSHKQNASQCQTIGPSSTTLDEDDEFLVEDDRNDENEVTLIQNPQQTKSHILQIIYCSRTHSQLDQIMHEFDKLETLKSHVSILQLGSRSNLCTNPQVFKLKHPEWINQTCLDLARKSKRCPKRTNRVALEDLSQFLLRGNSAFPIAQSIRSGIIKDDDGLMGTIGCPYYANRKNIGLAQLILVPYSILLTPSIRSACDLQLDKSIVILDEAHNLLEAMTQTRSAILNWEDLNLTGQLLSAYTQYYRSRLNPINLLRLGQLSHVVKKIREYFAKMASESHWTNQTVLTPQKLLGATNLDNLNFDQLSEFLQNGHFITKLVGFASWYSKRVTCSSQDKRSKFGDLLHGMKRKRSELDSSDNVNTDVSQKRAKYESAELDENAGFGLFKFHVFLQSFIGSEDDARIVVTNAAVGPDKLWTSDNEVKPNQISITLTVLNPGRYLKEIIDKARSVILIGGTLKPFDELIDQIFIPVGKSHDQINTFACGHVIDAQTQLSVYALDQSPRTHQPLDFTFQKRTDFDLMDECGYMLLNVCKRIPAGVVVFFPSYDYLSLLYGRWEKVGLLAKMEQYKNVYCEPKKSAYLEQIMEAYKQACVDCTKSGALLLCVIGGKLSEGINFADNLARIVIIVGMPYPNAKSPLLREKMAYLDSHFGHATKCPNPGRRYYEALCLRSINQAIGRAIRHANDYAAVLLMDRRFQRATVQSQLSSWIRPSLKNNSNFDTVLDEVDTFLKQNRMLFSGK